MIFNFNVGILGHVDSGKTSLAKTLSTTASTAAFDKNPQSQERGITLDLGFSSFSIDTPPKLWEKDEKFAAYSKIQFTLVDCPGHASLIKTVIGGAQIIDLVLLVIDCQKGIQTQTAECLILSEIVCPKHLMIVLNKIDLFEQDQRETLIDKISRKLRKTLESTVFKNAAIVPFSCLNDRNVPSIIDSIIDQVYFPERSGVNDPFLFAVDHCFGIKGQGTIMTGTIIAGTVKINDQVEIPSMKEVKK
uniref:Tr-type G domain-containing protein n=1 Tax=Romanomermis culicivorax TaxID=13658 RepID=A0A915IC53_ROMCU